MSAGTGASMATGFNVAGWMNSIRQAWRRGLAADLFALLPYVSSPTMG